MTKPDSKCLNVHVVLSQLWKFIRSAPFRRVSTKGSMHLNNTALSKATELQRCEL